LAHTKSELYFSILQHNQLTQNDHTSIKDVVERITAFGERYAALSASHSPGHSAGLIWSIG
jgi:hypothetical protein